MKELVDKAVCGVSCVGGDGVPTVVVLLGGESQGKRVLEWLPRQGVPWVENVQCGLLQVARFLGHVGKARSELVGEKYAQREHPRRRANAPGVRPSRVLEPGGTNR